MTNFINDSIENICKKSSDYHNAMAMLSDDPNAAEMNAVEKYKTGYVKALKDTITYLTCEIEAVQGGYQPIDNFVETKPNLNNTRSNTVGPMGDNPFKLIIGKYTKDFRRTIDSPKCGYKYVLTPWDDLTAIVAFKPKTRHEFYVLDDARKALRDERDYIRNNPTATDREDRLEYLSVLETGVNAMVAEMNTYSGGKHDD